MFGLRYVIFFFCRTANLEKGKESVKIVSNLLKGELASAVESADNQRERNSRKMQQSRYQKDFRDAMEAFQSVSRFFLVKLHQRKKRKRTNKLNLHSLNIRS